MARHFSSFVLTLKANNPVRSPRADLRVQQTLVRLLAATAEPFDALPLLDLFETTDSGGLRWAIANTIESASPQNAANWVLAAVQNPAYGKSREMLVAAIGKLVPPPVATPLLERIFDEFPMHAAMGLSAYGGEAELEFLESADVGDKHAAREVRKAIAAIKKRLAK